MPDNNCLLCGAPGGYPYCNADCREADNPDDETPTISAVDFGPLADLTGLVFDIRERQAA